MTKALSIPDDPREADTFPGMIRSAAAAFGDELFARLEPEEGEEPEAFTFAEIERKSAELARGLLARGAGKGARIGFIYGNCPSFVLVMAAIARIGAVAIPISTLIKGNELVRVLRQSDVNGLIVQRSLLGRDYTERLCDALPGLAESGRPVMLPEAPFLRWIASTGDGMPQAFEALDDIIAGGTGVSEELLEQVEAEVHSTDQMIEIYTSGSMALPKGVKHNHGPVLFRGEFVGRMQGVKRGVEGYCFLPMFWVGGLTISLLPNWVHGAATMFTTRTNINSQNAMGSVLSDDDLEALTSSMFKPYWGLGMTETLGPYTWGDDVRAPGRPMCAPMDHVADRYEVRIADEDNNPVGDGEIGEMQVRGYPVTPGLHKIERDVFFTPDGYFKTGDMCLVDGTRIHFEGRGGDMIKTASSNVSPAEVELELQGVEGVHNAYVVGIPDKDRGQIVVAALVAREGVGKIDPAQIDAQLRDNLSSYKIPRAYVQITREEVPMLHSNKVSKRLLADMMIERLGRSEAA